MQPVCFSQQSLNNSLFISYLEYLMGRFQGWHRVCEQALVTVLICVRYEETIEDDYTSMRYLWERWNR